MRCLSGTTKLTVYWDSGPAPARRPTDEVIMFRWPVDYRDGAPWALSADAQPVAAALGRG